MVKVVIADRLCKGLNVAKGVNTSWNSSKRLQLINSFHIYRIVANKSFIPTNTCKRYEKCLQNK